MKSAIALTFHGIDPQSSLPLSSIDPSARRYVVKTDFFKQTVNMVSPEKCCTVSEYLEKQKGDWLILTFDDGNISDFEVGFPGLEQRGNRATFFITVENIGLVGYAAIAHLRKMAESGMEIGSHGLTHQYLVTMSPREALREIQESKDRLEQAAGTKVVSFAPVGGHYKRWMKSAAFEAGYKVFATMIPGRTNTGGDLLLLKRNHIQSRHDMEYVTRLIEGDYRTLAFNRLRYHALRIPKVILGMKNYDLLKKYLCQL